MQVKTKLGSPQSMLPFDDLPGYRHLTSHLLTRGQRPVSESAGTQVTTVSDDEHRKFQGLQRDVLRPPYVLAAAYRALDELIQRHNALSAHLSSSIPADGIQMLEDDRTNELAILVDWYLEAARRSQDALVPIVGRTIRQSVPHSFRDLMKQISAKRSKVPAFVSDILLEYWQHGGEALRDYRDKSQHFPIVSSDGYAFRGAGGAIALILLLPNNPGADTSDLSYQPEVHAVPYCIESFRSLLGTFTSVVYVLARSVGPQSKMVLALGGRAPFHMGNNSGIVALPPATARDASMAAVQAAYAAAAKRWGSLGDAPPAFEAA